MARERATHVLLGHGHFGAVADPGFAAAAAVVDAGGAVRREGAAARCSTTSNAAACGRGSSSAWARAVPHHPSRRAAPRPRHHASAPRSRRCDEIRVLEPGTEAEVPDGRGGGAVLPRARTRCAATSTRRSTTRAPSPPTASTAPATSPRSRRSTASAASRIEGRIKDLINRGGEKINAEEVELLVLRHPRVAAAAVVAMPDPRLGERTCAYVVVDGEPLTLPEIQEHFAALGVAKFKWPERIEHLPEIPRTLVGQDRQEAPRRRRRREVGRLTITGMSSRRAARGPVGHRPAGAGGERALRARHPALRRARLRRARACRTSPRRSGITRPALYYYVKSKDELLAKLVTEVADGPLDELTALVARRRARPGAEAPRHRRGDRGCGAPPNPPDSACSSAPRPSSRPTSPPPTPTAAGPCSRSSPGSSRRGCAPAGSGPSTPGCAALGVIGMCNWVAWWFRPGARRHRVGRRPARRHGRRRPATPRRAGPRRRRPGRGPQDAAPGPRPPGAHPRRLNSLRRTVDSVRRHARTVG